MVVLIANRGEIARRVIRTCNEWGVESVAVYADPDAGAPHVSEATRSEHIFPAALDESYLSIEALIAATLAGLPPSDLSLALSERTFETDKETQKLLST